MEGEGEEVGDALHSDPLVVPAGGRLSLTGLLTRTRDGQYTPGTTTPLHHYTTTPQVYNTMLYNAMLYNTQYTSPPHHPASSK